MKLLINLKYFFKVIRGCILIINSFKLKNIFFYLILFSISSIFSQDITFVNSELHLKNDAPFSEATIVNGIIYLSGEIGTLPNDKVVDGGIIHEKIQESFFL